jgi:hypothetical protein
MKYSKMTAIKFLPMMMLLGAPVLAQTPQNNITLQADLNGFQEVPAVSTAAAGTFRAQIDATGNTVAFELSYQALEGNAQEAHIHFGQPEVNGGVSVFLCSNMPNPPPSGVATPPGVQSCPVSSGIVTGTIQASDVIGPTAQGIATAEIAKLFAAMRDGLTYVNVHSTKVPNGEIRGQITQLGTRPRASAAQPSGAAQIPASGMTSGTTLDGTTGTFAPFTAPGTLETTPGMTLSPLGTPNNTTSPGTVSQPR